MHERFVISNVKLITGEAIDIIIANGIIVEVVEAGYGLGSHIVDYSGSYVSSGWIDMHVHAFPDFDPYGDEIDEIGVKQGVTTIVDAGSCGADRIGELVTRSEKSDTRVFAFLNISTIGLARTDELSDLEWIDNAKTIQAVQDFGHFIVGLKARISSSVVGEHGLVPLHIARELAKQTSLPLMVHIGSGPPNIKDVIPLLEQKDIVTHYLNGKSNNLFDEEGKPLRVLVNAIERGVHLDVGHGSASFSFKVAEFAKQHHIDPHTISTDIYRRNRLNGPVYSMSQTLTKFLYLGYSLQEVIATVTTRAAEWLDKPELGRIQVGDVANLTIFTVNDEQTVLVDSDGIQRTSDKRIEAKGVVVNGQFIECEIWA
ncbi:amidohydrolase/deacetylase family metallohydrolase [Paenibacillus endoradicis]|uniref:amidohydrolase/deacetylase family metallohydrolase n=1 Tax=Paenibacillus endoradicis TaxID=2972487 RepID=UPI0021597D89|nr:amidohydrolase/deacetylase family metallohydrolase [Paenibacillus endoradicis]MCR8658925.1 amidohydrolase/deacetylase family metallohydrolase [Paenibacillus endoradicis]